MASPTIFNILSSFIILFSTQLLHVHSFHFNVGDVTGWIVPPKNDTKFYDEWASKNRFLVRDTLRFRYKKDSVMEVTEKEFNNCNSTRPISFSNNGHTKIKFERSGLFYFISGASGHCQRGQKMVVKVMSPEDDRSSSSSVFSGAYGGAAAAAAAMFCYFSLNF